MIRNWKYQRWIGKATQKKLMGDICYGSIE
jgi:hypothetical protein